MLILLDECMPRKLKRALAPHITSTVQELGWASVKNGNLLRLAAASGKVEAFITVDRGMTYQQNFAGLPFRVIVLRAYSNRMSDLQPLVPDILVALTMTGPGQVTLIGPR